MAGVTVQFSGDASKLEREIVKLQAKAQELEAKLRGVASAGGKVGNDLDSGISKALGPITSLAAGVLSVNAALNAGTQAWEVYLRNIREVSEEAKKANSELVVLATMQGSGQKAQAVQAAARLGASYGITNRALAFDTVQSLQASRGDDFKAGIAAAQQVFAATKVGISLESAREAEIIGASLGVRPGSSVRRAFVTGVISPRSPEEVIKASPGLRFWQDNVEAWAAAGVLSAGVNPEELETYVKAGGIGLSGEDKEFTKFLKKAGYRGSTQAELMRFLHETGLDTPEELRRAGVGEQRRQQSMATLAKNYPEFVRYREEIARRDVPGLFEQERGGVEAELPGVRMEREIAILQAEYANEKAFGARALEAMELERQQRIKGLALQKLGQTEIGLLGWDLMDDQGRYNPWPWAGDIPLRFWGGMGMAVDPGQLDREEMRITRQISQPFTEGSGPVRAGGGAGSPVDSMVEAFGLALTRLDLSGAVRELKDAVVRMKGGPTLVPTGRDE